MIRYPLTRISSKLDQSRSPNKFFMRKNSEKSSPCIWRKPKIGFVKLNFDGSSKNKSQNASIGGVYRDHKGNFLLGYSERIGKATSSISELIAAKRGIELALKNEWHNIWIEGDAKVVTDLLMKYKSRTCRMRSNDDLEHVEELNFMVSQFNEFTATHIYRSGNKAADRLAKMGFKMNKPKIWHGVPPYELKLLLHRDAESDRVI